MSVADVLDVLDVALAHESIHAALLAAAAAAGGWAGSRAKLSQVEAGLFTAKRELRAVVLELAGVRGLVVRLVDRLVARRTLHRNEVR